MLLGAVGPSHAACAASLPALPRRLRPLPYLTIQTALSRHHAVCPIPLSALGRARFDCRLVGTPNPSKRPRNDAADARITMNGKWKRGKAIEEV